MDSLNDDEGYEIEEFRLEMPGAVINCHRTLEDALDDPDGPKFAGIRAALELDPDSQVARVFEVTASSLPGRPVVREMIYNDGIVPRISVEMDEDNQVEVAIFCPATGALRRYSLAQLVDLCDLAKTASDQAVKSLELAQSLGEDNDRLKREIEHLRKLLGDRAPELSDT